MCQDMDWTSPILVVFISAEKGTLKDTRPCRCVLSGWNPPWLVGKANGSDWGCFPQFKTHFVISGACRLLVQDPRSELLPLNYASGWRLLRRVDEAGRSS